MTCKYGYLKSPTRGRRCKKKPRGRSSYRSRSRKTRSTCKHGYLKSSVGGRKCRKASRKPFNKGRVCVAKGTSRTGKTVCRSYGSRSGWRARGGRARRYPSASMFTGRDRKRVSWLGPDR